MSTPEFTPPPPTDATGNADDAVERIWRKLRTSVEITARDATSNQDDREEFIQAAHILLWTLEPSRVDLANPRDLRALRSFLNKHVKGLAAEKKRSREVRIEELPAEARRAFR